MKRLERALRFIGIGLGVLLCLAGLFVAWNWATLSSFPTLPAGYEAKELCSCLFVEGRPQPDCEAFIRQTVVPIDGRSFDVEGKAVTVTALWNTRRAHFVSPRHGCVIDGAGQ